VRQRAFAYRESWRRPFERSVDQERLRRRVLVFTGLWFLLAGLLAALGFGAVLQLTLAIALVGGGTAGAVWLLRRYDGRQRLRVVLRSIRSRARQLKAQLDDLGLQRRLRRFATRLSKLAALASDRARVVLARVRTRSSAWASEVPSKATGASDRARLVVSRGSKGSAAVGARVWARTSDVLQTGVALPAAPSREPPAEDPQEQALRLNELGAQLRREGNHELAAEQHRAALAIVRDLGDRQAEALTLNNLALALSHTGVPTALQHFEQSLVVLRELGDEEHEGQVIANLGFVHRRQGRSEEAQTLLHEALDKLPPGSSAYRHVEEQLRRAS
jgi:tetratricopeptide (TPR) repeat protein